ncbi:tautomerase family protein [Mucilaginibacter sp. KACC 22773]|uniref:tautomerase family protein n=1 Tax=Mucilaginibacter sp. KACC 22773 TaxID=3025671 RepID=UPI0023659BE4|nr:tautomerase family protein [Mucilaginibacter sp. KACC 22773]WDF77230.1 tautomerase family protein [Mucilaginibacter sp. KACC 22773]
MPHVHVKIAGKSKEDKARLAEEITKAVMNTVHSEEPNISVSIEDIEKDEWIEKVYKPDILGHWDQLYKKPGYDPLK